MHRKIRGLISAQPCAKPTFADGRRPRGRKGAGISYERTVQKAFVAGGWQCRANLWFEFEDARGYGQCSPDLVLAWQGQLIVVECKLTDVIEARSQILELYKPVLEYVTQKKVWGVVVSKNLTPYSTQVVASIGEALLQLETGIPLLHWLGHEKGSLARPL